MLINLVSETDWIYGKFVEAFLKYSKHNILVNSKSHADIQHFIPYYNQPKPKHTPHPCTIWASHMETKDPLKTKFISSAKVADYIFSQSQKYATELIENGIDRNKISVVSPGIDQMYMQRKTKRSENDKLVVRWVGRRYKSSGRKNNQLIQRVSDLDFIDFSESGGKLKDDNMLKFVQDADIIISPSLVEGGPLCINESLATGTPVLCYEGVGVADEFDIGVIKVPFGDSDEFIFRLKTMHKTKSYLHYRKPEIMNQMRSQVLHQTWKKFVKQHDKVWKSLVQ